MRHRFVQAMSFAEGRTNDVKMCATSLAALLFLSYIFAVVAAWAVEEDTGVGPPPALAVGQAPPLPKPGPLAEPLPSNDAAKRDD